jgi:Mannitol-1-phosphate/altronate dehydrogenases
MRNIPLLQKYVTRTQQLPEYMVMGFAAYLLFMKGREDSKGLYEGVSEGNPYVIQDDHAVTLSRYWENNEPGQVVDAVLSDSTLWGTDLSLLKGFSEAVKHSLQSLLKNGVMETIHHTLLNKTGAG